MADLFSPASVLFLCLILIVLYTYVGYGVVIWFLVKVRRKMGIFFRPATQPAQAEDVTIVVPAYNELAYLPAKLQNCLDQDYPAAHLHFLFVVEGSNDGSAEYLEQAKATIPNLSTISGSRRLGKIEAMNNAMPQVKTPITIFTDANTELNLQAVTNLVKRFYYENVGAVTGEKRIRTNVSESAAGSGEGLYWRYESFLKRLDAELHTIVGAAGELFAIRTELYGRVEADTLLDDFMISLRIAEQGYRVEYEPDAYAFERPSHSVAEEMKRKVRIATGGFQSISRLKHLFNFFKYGWLSFQYTSHRVLRWAVTPFCLPMLVLLNIFILVQLGQQNANWVLLAFWWLVFIGQVGFYLLAYTGYVLENKQTRWKLAFVPFYFVFMNWCVLLGFVRYCNGNISGVWEKAKRAE